MNFAIIVAAMIAFQTTQPASMPEELVRLHRIISQLKAEVAALKRENAELKKKLGETDATRPGNAGSIHQRPRPSDPTAAFKKLKEGMSVDQVCDILGYPGGPGRPGSPIEDTAGNAEYFWDYAPDSRTSGTTITAWFKTDRLIRAEKN
jgi:hypothetical protein